MTVIYLCDKRNNKSENTHYCEYEGYNCGDIVTFSYCDKDGKLEEIELCSYPDDEGYESKECCLELFKSENNIQYLDIRTKGQGFRGWKMIKNAT